MKKIVDSEIWNMIEDSLTYHSAKSWHHRKSSLKYHDWYFLPGYTLSYMIEGKVKVNIKDESGQIRTLHWQSGDILFLSSGLLRHTELEDEKNIHFMGVEFNFTIFQHVDPLLFFNFPLLYQKQPAAKIASQIAKIVDLENNDSLIILNAALRKAAMFSMLSELLSQATLKENGINNFIRIKRLLPAIQYINDCDSRNINFDSAAQYCNLSLSRFYAVFKKVMACSPGEYALQLRLTAAAKMLLDSNMSVGEIAWACGWDDVFHFSRIFKQRYKLAPKFYREKANAMFDMW